MFKGLADIILRRAKLIISIWVIILICAIPFAIQSGSALEYDMTKMESPASESVLGAEMLNSDLFSSSGVSSSMSTVVVAELNDDTAYETSRAFEKALQEEFANWSVNIELKEKYPGENYAVTTSLIGVFDDKYFKDTPSDIGLYSVSYPVDDDGNAIVKGSDHVLDIRNLVSAAKATLLEDGDTGVEATYVTGSDPISYDTMTGATSDIEKIDPISILLILILIGLFFRSFVSAATPPITIGIAYAIVLCLMFGIGQVLGIYYITSILVLVSMLGAGCDYCIFIISRYREERKNGLSHDDALKMAIMWAGESILTSGCSVIIGFGVMSFCSFSLVSTMGLILALGIVLALLAALTFIPSVLALVGDKIFWPSNISTYEKGSKAMKGWYGKMGAFGHRYFTHSAHTSIKYAKVMVVVAILITVPLAYVAVTSTSSYDMISTMPDGEAKEGVSVISDDIGGGTIMPSYVVMKVKAFVDVNENPDETVPSYFMTTMEDGNKTLLYGYVYLDEYDAAVKDGTDLNVYLYAKTTDDTWYSTEGKIPTSSVKVVYSEDGTPTVTVSTEAQTAMIVIYNDWQTVESAKFDPSYSVTLGCYVMAESKTDTTIKDISGTIANPDNLVIQFTDTTGLTMWGTIYMSDFTTEATTVPVFLDAVYTTSGLEEEHYYAVLSFPISDIAFVENYHNTTIKMTAAGEESIITSYNAWQTDEDAKFGDVKNISMSLYAPDGTSTSYIASDISATYQNTDAWLYRPLANADQTYIDFDDFSSNLVNIVTDGQHNVAMAVGPTTGDILFDGKHAVFFETIYGILPSAIRELLPSDSYTVLCELWTLLDDEEKDLVNYLLTYEMGTVSAIDETGEYQYVKFIVLTKDEPMSDLSMETVQQLSTEKDRFFDTHYYVEEAHMAGAAVSNYEISEIVSNDFNTIMVVVVLLLIALLFIVMKSYLTPIRAVATIVMSILWTLGLTFILFDHILGIPVVWIVPIVLFVICLGLGMDYDILLTTRIKENVHAKGMSNDDAIIDAVQRSGAVITLCGLIMGGAFLTMTMSTSPMLQEFGFALGFAILIDALIIRTYVVPAMMHLMGEWNWKGPAFMHKKKQSV
ncbi:MAG: MMPL family transporter [Candidatus Methanomethylophilaceae archaeon]|jgi:uncharacterized membrane protein YdfJ with MMPL/SSD domain